MYGHLTESRRGRLVSVSTDRNDDPQRRPSWGLYGGERADNCATTCQRGADRAAEWRAW